MAKKTLYFDSYCGYFVAAATEDGKLSDFNFEKPVKGCVAGNVYKGRVSKILPGMQAAFVDCGLERNCYLSFDEPLSDADYFVGDGKSGLPELKEGDEICVQVIKPPMGNKGAKVTARLSFVGNSLVYFPTASCVAVSRKISDGELRTNLAYAAEKLKSAEEGLIVRTAAPYVTRDELEKEYEALKNLYKGVMIAYEKVSVGTLLYADSSLPLRILRDVQSKDIEEIVVGSPELQKGVEKLMDMVPPNRRCTVKLHSSPRDLMDEVGVSEQLSELISRRVDLENGAYLIIEKTEALTVIDVNTGSFTGDDKLEDTAYYTNTLAAREVARQVRLRNIGGIVVVDFIDMKDSAHGEAVTAALENALKGDRAKCQVAPMSQFGLVEFTRKRTGASARSRLTKTCCACRGTGRVVSDEYTVFEIRARVLGLYADGARNIKVDMGAEVLLKLSGWTEMLQNIKNRCPELKLYGVPHRSYHGGKTEYSTEFELNERTVRLI